VQIEGIAEKATLRFIIRDFVTSNLLVYENYLRDKLEEVLKLFPGASATFTVEEQYRNMKEVMDKYPDIISFAREAIERAGCIVRSTAIRGGTDGARLSYMGLPCPNIFTGEMALHGKHEYVSVQDMQKSVETILNLVSIWEEKAD
ncbi:MAG: M20/M25/M40 family metallo-hydrolase, partial [Chitinophagaceae bacterium]